MLGLYYCVWALFSCGEWGLLSGCREQASHCDGPSCGAQAQQVWCMGLTAPQHVGSSWTRDQTGDPNIARWILNHWTTREALRQLLISMICSRAFLWRHHWLNHSPRGWISNFLLLLLLPSASRLIAVAQTPKSLKLVFQVRPTAILSHLISINHQVWSRGLTVNNKIILIIGEIPRA